LDESIIRFKLLLRIERVQQLLSVGINVNSWDSEISRNTPLHWAACYSNKDMVQYLTGILVDTVVKII
jgi:ankyrin repeat protein